jgi:hypothetical protein
MVSSIQEYEVLWPRGSKKTVAGIGCAQRVASLDGMTIGELWNGVFRGDSIFPMIEHELKQRYPNIRFVHYNEFGFTGGGEGAKVVAALPAKLQQRPCDAIISGVGC